jgi:Competence protein J (ComJ)
MIIDQFDVTVSYTQIVVFVSGITPPEFDWTDEHVAQGFAWMPTIVSFGVPDHDGQCRMKVETVTEIAVDPKALWAIRVPFDVPSVPLSIGSIFDVRDVRVPEGKYSMIFEALPGDTVKTGEYAFALNLKFLRDATAGYEILKQGTELATSKVLREGL